MSRIHRRLGFTLIELLVVVAIIALLIAILLPSLGKAKTRARTAACLANVHSIGNSVKTYVADWSTMIPYGTTAASYWIQTLIPYGNVEKVRFCPEVTEIVLTGTNVMGTAHGNWYNLGTGNSSGPGCYGLNGWLYNLTGATTANLFSTGVANPAVTAPEFWHVPISRNESIIPSIGDCCWANGWPRSIDAPPTLAQEETPASVKKDLMQRWTMARHGGKNINIAFFDGHAETVGLSKLWNLQWSVDVGGNTPFAGTTPPVIP